MGLGLISLISQGTALALADILLRAAADASAPAADAATRTLIARGQYGAQLGDCIACHTAEKGS